MQTEFEGLQSLRKGKEAQKCKQQVHLGFSPKVVTHLHSKTRESKQKKVGSLSKGKIYKNSVYANDYNFSSDEVNA